GVVFPSTLPILRMDQVDMAILVGFSCRFSPVQVFIPFDTGSFELVEFTQQRHRATEVQYAIVTEKTRKMRVYDSTFLHGRKDHAHKNSLVRQIIRKSR